MDIEKQDSFLGSISASVKAEIMNAFRDLPTAFIPNAGQAGSRVCYYSNSPGCKIFFTSEEAAMVFIPDRPPKQTVFRGGEDFPDQEDPVLNGVALFLSFIGSNHIIPEGRMENSGKVSYFTGSYSDKWYTGLPIFEEIVYHDLWPNVDLIFKGNNRQIKYEFIVHPHSDLHSIKLTYRGADSLSLDEQGNLQIQTPFGVLIDERPASFQIIDGRRVPVASIFLLERQENGEIQYGFSISDGYDPCYPLVIDPGLVYSTYLGGSGDDGAAGIVIDAGGNAYVTGTTDSEDFPTTPGAFQTTLQGSLDAFVTKLNPTGTALVYSTYLGGSSFDLGNSLTVDVSGNVYVAGQTGSADFPTSIGAFQTTLKGTDDAFVTKLNPTGTALVYSTYLGGSGSDGGYGADIDASGNAYVIGTTDSTDFPATPGAFQTTLQGGTDAFVTKLNPTGTALVYSTYLGGGITDGGNGIVIDVFGNAYVTGTTNSTNYPTTPGAFQSTLQGGFDVFVTELSAAGTALVYSTYLGGSGDDNSTGIAANNASSIYVTGDTASVDFPTTPGVFQTTLNGSANAFVSLLSATPQISVTPPSFDFGSVTVGQTSPPQAFIVQNIGSTDLFIFSVIITGANATEFVITFSSCPGSTLSPGATCVINVVFAPKTAGPESAFITIDSSDPSTPVLSVPLEGDVAPVPFTAKDCILVNKIYDQCFTEELVTSQIPVSSSCPGVTIPAGATVACIPIPGSATCTFAGTVAVTPPLTPYFEEVLVINSFQISAPILVAGVTVCAPTLTLTGAARADLWVPPGTTVNCDILAFGDCTCTLLASPTGLPVVIACTGKICKELQITAPVKLLVPTYGFCEVPACTFLAQPGFVCPPTPLFPPERCQGTPTVTILGTGPSTGLTLGAPVPSGVVVTVVRAGVAVASATTDLTGTATFPTIGGLEGAIDVVQFMFLGKLVSFPIPLEFVDTAGVSHDSATTCSLIFTQTGTTTTGLPILTVTINGFLATGAVDPR